ncbi:MAG: DUF1176 domain-containing protein [Sphingomonas sp.]|uniref:DUF1176 domain-containing protein n=1 Tax=Sphingomonas sp. TaxID=28214 RepID=UPI003F80FC8E
MPMLLLAALAAVTTPTPQPGEIKTFKDWVVACDNIWSCVAETQMSDNEDAEGEDGRLEDYHQIDLTRTGRANAPIVIEVSVEPEKGAAVLMVDGTAVQSLGSATRMGVSGALTPATLARMAQGSRLEIRVAGKIAASGSLAGFSAAMRYCDAAQRRDGSPDAIIARGPTVRSIQPPAAPRIAAARVPTIEVPALDEATTAKLEKQFDCESGLTGRGRAEAYALGGGRTLILVPCQDGPYNTWSRPVIAVGKTYTLAPFDLAPENDVLVDGGFDAKTASLTSFERDRGGGACGRGQEWVWDGARFRLTDMDEMPDCTGSSDAMRTWTATVVR